jgi:uncharacterized protein with NRDE domain
MCLISVAWHAHQEFPCVIAANRDEAHARPSAGAQWWQEHPDLLAGRDLVAGGTWFGITRSGRFAAVTNYRNPALQRNSSLSRGSLVAWFLTASISVAEGLEHLSRVSGDFNGFTLFICDGTTLGVHESVGARGRELGPGVYGLSNHLLDSPWPKVTQAKSRLIEALGDAPNEEVLLASLRDERRADEDQLPVTGVGLERERQLSSAFIRSADYGTRSSTIVWVDRRGKVRFHEWRWDSAGLEIGQTLESFVIEPALDSD